MPLGYGGGIKRQTKRKRFLTLVLKKIAINTQAVENPFLIGEIAKQYGSQAVIASIDVKQGTFGNPRVKMLAGTVTHRSDPVNWAVEVEKMGAGEILLTAINNEGHGQVLIKS